MLGTDVDLDSSCLSQFPHLLNADNMYVLYRYGMSQSEHYFLYLTILRSDTVA